MIHKIVGENITRIVLQKYPSLRAFCTENDLPYESTWKVIKCKYSPSLRTLETLAIALNVKVIDFFRE